MNQMTAQYNLERAKLDASKAEVVSADRRRQEPHRRRHLRRRTEAGEHHP